MQVAPVGHNFGKDGLARTHCGHAVLATLAIQFKSRLGLNLQMLTLGALLPEAGPSRTQSLQSLDVARMRHCST